MAAKASIRRTFHSRYMHHTYITFISIIVSVTSQALYKSFWDEKGSPRRNEVPLSRVTYQTGLKNRILVQTDSDIIRPSMNRTINLTTW